MAALIKFIIAFLVLAASFSTNADGNMLARMGLESSAVLIGGVSLLLAFTVAMHHTGFVPPLLILAVLANAPDSLSFGVNQDFYAAGFLALLVIPAVLHYME